MRLEKASEVESMLVKAGMWEKAVWNVKRMYECDEEDEDKKDGRGGRSDGVFIL